jgi:phenylalanyl-tRNA synthetase beta chain
VLISFAWLRDLVRLDADAPAVARALTARGLTVDAIGESGGDAVFDIDVPANRPDCLGHRGVAREVAAAFGATMAPRGGVQAFQGRGGDPVDASVTVAVEAPDLCGRYTARIVRGVTVGPSPAWVVARLQACGQRSINNVVDASNLVMLELGQPVHFFDFGRLRGPAIVVRRAGDGETLKTLDGVLRRLGADDLVIADAGRAVALAGILGGGDTEIGPHTRDVLIEAAWFLPQAVRRTARAQGLVTDASQRFTRGADPEAPVEAQLLATVLLNRLAAGVPARGTIDVRSRPPERRTIAMRLGRAETLLGFSPSLDEAVEALQAVGLAPVAAGSSIEITVPSWRVDLTREADVVEEVGRHLGYDRVPARTPNSAPRSSAHPPSSLEEEVRDRLAALGFHEAFNYSMIGPGEDDPFVASGGAEPLALANPISEALSRLRRSLAPGLAASAGMNLRRGSQDVRLFEVGKVFRPREPGALPNEPLHVAFAWSGAADPRHWGLAPRAVDTFDAAGLVEDVLSLAAGAGGWTRARCTLSGIHPGRGVSWRRPDGGELAWCGPVHPDLAARLDLPAPVLLGEIDLGSKDATVPVRPYRPIPRVPSVTRDLSIVLEEGVPAGSVVARLSEVEAPAPARLAWLDRYAGPPLKPGEVAMTLRVILQPFDRTLTDPETEGYRSRLLEALETVPGVHLRRIDT